MIRIIFLDIDKTLIPEYDPEPAKPIIEELKRRGFEIVFNSSKTRAEQEYYRRELGIDSPFISENGSAIFIPKGYFPFDIKGKETKDYIVIELGVSVDVIRRELKRLENFYGLKYYGNSSKEEIVEFTGMPEDLVPLAMEREYSETVFRWSRESWKRNIEEKGFAVTMGSRFFSVHGKSDKGKAAKLIIDFYRRLGPVRSYAVGDSYNDFPMFDVVDNAFIIGNLRHEKAQNVSSIVEVLEVI
ncbi:mannosyl-3-phosphoglycerate phosphatase [Pyrococcus sp. NA2]|uniref:mannosyl-3-phosphoglycerate phosphatase n=1 Tax=Pyrococcus sp. (strain NA2) TaxID=342949 RepID=UPI000209AF8E|nr:mannosyl-3-phosphoglycerate phosphatase [Pyrococcus sp. NA2]AEC52370.1 mannosyl-3-phosphoglycerate phosphatase [Pyrococcus sp. NA2]